MKGYHYAKRKGDGAKNAAVFALVLAVALGLAMVSAGPVDDLARAARRGDVEKIKEMLAAGVDVNALDRQGYTALYWAVWRNKKKNVPLCLRMRSSSQERACVGLARTPKQGCRFSRDLSGRKARHIWIRFIALADDIYLGSLPRRVAGVRDHFRPAARVCPAAYIRR
ncbi:MAG: ankyrin repeat domain-containing protein [Planctomycetes bacterium]|nr:ankyrin repeat domain-containing protein [Planctomycetota bacterium]